MSYRLSTKAVPEDARFTKLRNPSRKNTAELDSKYPFAKLGLTGKNAFFVPDVTAREIRGAVFHATKTLKRKFITRTALNGAYVIRVQ